MTKDYDSNKNNDYNDNDDNNINNDKDDNKDDFVLFKVKMRKRFSVDKSLLHPWLQVLFFLYLIFFHLI